MDNDIFAIAKFLPEVSAILLLMGLAILFFGKNSPREEKQTVSLTNVLGDTLLPTKMYGLILTVLGGASFIMSLHALGFW